MSGVIEELAARGLLQATDPVARKAADAAIAQIDKHEAVCAERYKGIKDASEALASAMLKLGEGMDARFKNMVETIDGRLGNGNKRFRRLEMLLAALVVAVISAAVAGDNPFFDRALEIGVKIAARFAGVS